MIKWKTSKNLSLFSTFQILLIFCLSNIARGRGRGPGRGRDRAINLECDRVVSEPVMADDQRLQRHENQVENLSSCQERLLKQMEELVGVMNSRLDLPEEGSVNRNRGPHGQGGVRSAGGLVVPKFAKLDFPRYDGSKDPTLWICRTEQFFEFQRTSLEESS